MMPEEYKSNSDKSREQNQAPIPEKNIGKAIAGNAKLKKKSGISKFREMFISEDAGSVTSYIMMGVLVPAIKKALVDIVTNGIDMILYGESGHSKRNSPPGSRVSYRAYYDENRDRREYSAARARTGYDCDDIFFETRGDAEEVLSRMDELMDSYGMVSVADALELSGITGNYTDNRYGWTGNELKDVKSIRVNNGYTLNMPRPHALN